MTEKTVLQRLMTETWPAKMAHSALQALMLPGQVASGELATQPTTPGMWSDVDEARSELTQGGIVNRASDLAGLLMGGSYAAPAVANSVGMGVRSLPADNYLTPLSKYTDKLYRETSPEAALEVLPSGNVYAGMTGGQAQRQFYADTPEMALGQGANKGVRVGYDANAFEGQINQSKPMWAPMFEQGSAEYIASPMRNANVRDAVQSINIDKAALNSAPRAVRAQFSRLVEKLKSDGWQATDTKDYLDLVRKYGLAGAAAIGATYSNSDARASQ